MLSILTLRHLRNTGHILPRKTGTYHGAGSITLGETLLVLGEEAEGPVLFPCRQIAAVVVAGAQPELPDCSLQAGSPWLGWAGLGSAGWHQPCPITAGIRMRWRKELLLLLHPDLNSVLLHSLLYVRLAKNGSRHIEVGFCTSFTLA